MVNATENNKRIARNTFLLYFRMLFTMAVTLYTSRIVLKTLGIEDYGIYNIVGGVVVMFSFLNTAMAGATQRYLNIALAENDPKKLQLIFNTSIYIHLIVALLILILAETIGLYFLYDQLVIPQERMDAAVWVYQCSVLSAFILIISVPYNALIIAHERMDAFAYISIAEVVAKLLVVFVLSIFHVDKLILYAVLILVVQLIIRFIYQIYCTRQFHESHFKLLINKTLIKEMSSFAGWSLLGNIAIIGLTQGLNILLNIFFGPAVNAARGVAVQVQQAVNGFAINFQTAINPQIVKNYAVGDYCYMNSLVIRSAKFSMYVLLLLSLPILIQTPYILSLWLGNVPEHAANFIRIILVISIIDASSNSLVTAINATGIVKIYQITIGVILLLTVPISYLLLNIVSYPEIVFIVHFAVNIVAIFARLYFVKHLLNIKIMSIVNKVYIKFFVVAVISSIIPLICYYLTEHSFFQFLCISTLTIITSVISIYLIGLDKAEKKILLSLKSKLIHKLKRN